LIYPNGVGENRRRKKYPSKKTQPDVGTKRRRRPDLVRVLI